MSSLFLLTLVLIETLWNVKYQDTTIIELTCEVLIETLWNVKKNGKGSKTSAPSINRNIVECKGEHKKWILRDFAVLIETLWNVKGIYVTGESGVVVVLIETLWNVK